MNSLQLDHLPKMRVSVTDWCNFKCSFCGGIEFPMENWRLDKGQPLSSSDFFQLVECYTKLGGIDVHITGGEPLGRPDLLQLIEKLSKAGCRVELNTNGVLLTKAIVEQLKSSGLYLLKISLHSATKDGFREITRSLQFEKLLTAIRFASSQLVVRTNMVVMRSNLDQVIPVVELSQQLGASKIHLLDLTYYPDWTPELTNGWVNQYVPLSVIVAPLLIQTYGKDFVDQGIFGCKFYEMPLDNGFKVILKEAEPTLRHPIYCTNCPTFCHEGMFMVRVSFDGYVNICPTENTLGFDVHNSIIAGTLEKNLQNLFIVLSEAKTEDSWKHFLEVNNLALPMVFTEKGKGWTDSLVVPNPPPVLNLNTITKK